MRAAARSSSFCCRSSSSACLHLHPCFFTRVGCSRNTLRKIQHYHSHFKDPHPAESLSSSRLAGASSVLQPNRMSTNERDTLTALLRRTMLFHLIRVAILLAAIGPILAIPALFLAFYLRRGFSRRKRQAGNHNPGFSPSTFALGFSLQYLQMTFTQPSVAYILEQKYDQDADEDDHGDPDHPQTQFNRQLKRIRRGEPVDRLIVSQH